MLILIYIKPFTDNKKALNLAQKREVTQLIWFYLEIYIKKLSLYPSIKFYSCTLHLL